MNYLVLSYCADVEALRAASGLLEEVDIAGMFKEIRYSEDNKSIGILEVPANLYIRQEDEEGNVGKNIFDIVNSQGVVLKELAACIKFTYKTDKRGRVSVKLNDVYSELTEEGIADIRTVIPESTVTNEEGVQEVTEHSYRFASLT